MSHQIHPLPVASESFVIQIGGMSLKDNRKLIGDSLKERKKAELHLTIADLKDGCH